MAERTCSVDGCGRHREARGWCKMHYGRWRKWGNPDVVGRPGRPRQQGSRWQRRLADRAARLASPLVCIWCGGEISTPNAKKYCKPECAAAHRASLLLRTGFASRLCALSSCGAEFRPEHKLQRCCCEEHGALFWRVKNPGYQVPKIEVRCVWCGRRIERIASRVGTYLASCCSTACQRAWQRSLVCKLPVDHMARWIGKSSDIEFVPCRGCNRLLVHRSGDRRAFCSDECKRVAKRARFMTGRCRRCGDWFTTDTAAGFSFNAAYCSVRCGTADARARRRARRVLAFVAPVSPYKIFERDGWRCHLCRKKVRRNAVVPHPLAPTIDHVIPLAANGTHEPANARCAHFKCNSLKSDGSLGPEQLMLIG